MKHSGYFKIALLVATMLLAGCIKHDELEFKGKVVFVRQCEFSYLDQNPGYMVQLEYPEGVGSEYVDGENVAENVIVLYEPDKHIMVGDVIHGKFYLSPKYSKANCSVHWDYELPEGVFTQVVIE